MNTFRRLSCAAVSTAALACSLALPIQASAQSAATPTASTVRIRGTVAYADAPVSEVYRIKLADIRQGSFIGTAAMPQPDGTQKALEVLVFPEAARGTGEGHSRGIWSRKAP